MDKVVPHYPLGFAGLWIPRYVALDGALSPVRKMIVSMIYALDRDKQGCFASNAHLCRVLGIGERTLRYHLSFLRENQYVWIEDTVGRGRRMYIDGPFGDALRESEIPYQRPGD